jgi:hypothetical protein
MDREVENLVSLDRRVRGLQDRAPDREVVEAAGLVEPEEDAADAAIILDHRHVLDRNSASLGGRLHPHEVDPRRRLTPDKLSPDHDTRYRPGLTTPSSGVETRRPATSKTSIRTLSAVAATENPMLSVPRAGFGLGAWDQRLQGEAR